MQQLSTVLSSLPTLKDLVRDREVDEIHVSPSGRIRYQKTGQRHDADEGLSRSELRKLAEAIDAIAWPSAQSHDRGTTVAEQGPFRWMKIAHPVAKDGVTLYALRRRVPRPTTSVLVREGFATRQSLRLLERTLERGEGLLIAGPPRSGKTRLLSALLGKFPSKSQVVVLEGQADIDTEGLEVTSLRREMLPSQGPERAMVEHLISHADVVVADEAEDPGQWTWLRPASGVEPSAQMRLLAFTAKDAPSAVRRAVELSTTGTEPIRFRQDLNLQVLVACGVEDGLAVIKGVYRLPEEALGRDDDVPALDSLVPNVPDLPRSSLSVVARTSANLPLRDARPVRTGEDEDKELARSAGDPSSRQPTPSEPARPGARGEVPEPEIRVETEVDASPPSEDEAEISGEEPDEPAVKVPPVTGPQRSPKGMAKPKVRSIKSTRKPDDPPEDESPANAEGPSDDAPVPEAKTALDEASREEEPDEANLRLNRRLSRPATPVAVPSNDSEFEDDDAIPIDELIDDEDESTIDRPMVPVLTPRPSPELNDELKTAEVTRLPKSPSMDEEDEPTQQTNLELVLGQARALQQQRAKANEEKAEAVGDSSQRQPRRTLSRMLDRKNPPPLPMPLPPPDHSAAAMGSASRRSTIERGVATSYRVGSSQSSTEEMATNDDGPEPTVSTRAPQRPPTSATQRISPASGSMAADGNSDSLDATSGWNPHADPTTRGALSSADDLFALAGESAAEQTSEFRSSLGESDAGRYGYGGRSVPVPGADNLPHRARDKETDES